MSEKNDEVKQENGAAQEADTQEKEEKTQAAESEEQSSPEETDNGKAGEESEKQPESGKQAKKGIWHGRGNKELEQLKQQNEEYLNALKRERADFENYKRRNAQVSASSYANGAGDVIAAILPAIDNLERAMASETTDENFKTGVEMVLRQLMDILSGLGVSEIKCDGQPFDPAFHHAVMQVEKEEGEESGIVKEVLQKGYQFKDKVIRYALVKVTN